MLTPMLRRTGVSAPLCRNLMRIMGGLVLLIGLIWTPAVYAHASLVATTPAAGSVLSQAPTTVHLRFNEPVAPLVMKLIQPDGTVLDLTQVELLPNALALALPPMAREGSYGVSWRVTSSDGHPVGGTLTFSIGARSPHQAHLPRATPLRNSLIWIFRLSAYIGLFFGVGWAVCRTQLIAKSAPSRPELALLTVAAIATAGGLGLLGIDALDLPLSAFFSAQPWHIAMVSSAGLAAVLALVALAFAAVAAYTASVAARAWTAATALLLTGISLAASGHASTATPTWLARPAVWLHVVAVVLWIGSLLPLAGTLGGLSENKLLKRFSQGIPAVLLAVFASGGVLMYLQLNALSALWQTSYGQILMLKLGLVVLLLTLGAYNRYRLTNAALRSDPTARIVMRRVIFIECAVVIGILALVALWRYTPPPRALLKVAPSTTVVSAHAHTGDAMADLLYQPATPEQPATLTLYLSAPDLSPLPAQELQVAFSNPETGIEPINYLAQRVETGVWQVSGITLPPQQRWQIRIDALISDFDRIRLDTDLSLQTNSHNR